MTKTTYYKKVVPSRISLLPPIKNTVTKAYESQVLYDKDMDLVVQSPILDFKNDPVYFLFSEEKYPEFCLFLSELRESIINTLVSKSESFFKGKVFSYDEISARFPGLYKNCDIGDGSISRSNFIIDFNAAEDSFEQKKVQCILKFEKIIFKKSEIILHSRILKTKEVYGKKKFSVSEECVFEDDADDFFCENDDLC